MLKKKKCVERTPEDELEGRVQHVSCSDSNQFIPQQVRKISKKIQKRIKLRNYLRCFTVLTEI